MISLPWQVVAAFIGLFAVQMILSHFKRMSCSELIQAEKRSAHRDAVAAFREAYRLGWAQGEADGQKIAIRSEENNDV